MRHIARVFGSPWSGVFGTDIESTRQYDRHWHETFGVGVLEQGAHRSLSGRGTVDAFPGDVITTNPEEVHDGRPLIAPSRRWRMVYFAPDVLHAMLEPSSPGGRDIALTQPVIRDAVLTRVVRRLIADLEHWHRTSPTGLDRLRLDESLTRVCERLLECHATTSVSRTPRPALDAVCDRLADDVCGSPSLAELAAIVALSRYQLLRHFERVFGVTPHGWLRQLRVERARAAIRTGADLVRAAADCGFADQSHMTRAFVAHFGFTPGAWARATRRRR
ncbi:MAG: AraC family transcriptional regulator [Vicinamibacterales bacterium]